MRMEGKGWGRQTRQMRVQSRPQMLDLSAWPLALLGRSVGMCSSTWVDSHPLLAGELFVRSDMFS